MRRLGEGSRRRKLINQPNENIPTDTKTSYSDIKVVVGGDGGRRGGNVGGTQLEVIKGEMSSDQDDERDFKGQTGYRIIFTIAV